MKRIYIPLMEGERRRSTMPKSLACRDVGMNCDFKTQGNTEQEVMQKVSEHAKKAHNMQTIPPDVERRARSAIRDVK
jgi:predicted small metal-binding protein